MRALPISPSSSSGFASPVNMENSNNPKANPPLQLTENLYNLQTSDGQNVRPEILGKIDKGFFMADNDWTCYRRNYFQLSCSYTLHPFLPISSVQLIQGGNPLQVYGFSMSIAAVVDGRDGRAIELVQHTPKRDKGPQVRPDQVTLSPRPHPTATIYGSSAPGSDITMGGTRSTLYETTFGSSANQPQTEHTFERIQFKQATANNGKRRAAQQYYHLLVELFADVGANMGDNRWIKVAQRVSAPMVVRGRSPGHYHSERRPSNASAGGSAGGGGGSYGSNGGITPRPNEPMSIPSGSAVAHSYGSSYEQRSHYFPPAHASHINTPMEPIMSSEEVKAIDETEGYLYYPAPLFEGSAPHSRYGDNAYTLPNLTGPKIKQEFSGHGHHTYNLPSLTSGAPLDSLGRQCGRFEGLPSSRGYYPTVFTHHEVNTS